MFFFLYKTIEIHKNIVSLQSFNPYIGEDSNIVVTKTEKYDIMFNMI